MWPPRIIVNESALEKKAEPGIVVMVCLPALIKSASTSSSVGNGPMPSRPFSDCNVTFMPSGNMMRHQRRDADAEIDIVTVAQLLRSALCHQFADRIFFFAVVLPCTVRNSIRFWYPSPWMMRSTKMPGVSLRSVSSFANLDELLHLSDADFAAAGDHRIKVP